MKKLQNAFHLTAKYALRGVPQDEFDAYFPEGTLADNIIATAYDGYCQVYLMDTHYSLRLPPDNR